MANTGRKQLDLRALRDRRAAAILVVVALGVATPLVARLTFPYWVGASALAQVRLLIRLGGLFVLAGAYPAVLVLVRLSLTDVSVYQHRALLRLYPVFCNVFQVLVALDGFLLVVWPERFALPVFWADLLLAFVGVGLPPVVLHHQTWLAGFDPHEVLSARRALEEAGPLPSTRTPLDTLDYRVLQLVAQSGSDVSAVMINDMAIGARDLNLRLHKLVALGYLDVVDEQHGPQLTLTASGTDTLTLPVSLFTWQTNDLELLQELASARLGLEERQPHKVVVACARCCERLLRGLLSAHEPPVTSVGGKEVGRATLGELVGACRQHRLIGRFEDNILSALNERRKKIHALQDERPIDDQDAFILYTLTEITARALMAQPATASMQPRDD
ncbi:MAG: hypothetical protein JXB05_01470 [Myxococcaceae bacterium]|nr:hypothetical protein [Myxococcaceae bacterium]